MELVEQLVKSLGISEGQAKGGAGLLFKTAKDNLGADDFSKVADAVPGMDSLLSAAPSDNGGGLMDAVSSLAGGSLGNLGNLAGLLGGFSKLGLDGDMVSKFLPIVLSFVQSKGGDGVKDILAKVLK